MSVVKINAVDVPEGMGAEFLERFAKRAGSVENQPGFEEFLLLSPSDENRRFFVFTRWESEAAFEQWMSSNDFASAHARVSDEAVEEAVHGHGEGAGHGEGHGQGRPVAVTAELLAFDVVERVVAPGRA